MNIHLKPRNEWSKKELKLLTELYPDTDTPELSRLFFRTIKSLYAKAKESDIGKTEEFRLAINRKCGQSLRESGKRHQYKKGLVPWNKGKKGVHYSPATEFKPGSKPVNTRNVGDTRICSKNGYILVKVRDRVWVGKHRLVWEAAHGKIPRGYNIQFKDGNVLNCELDNLEMLSKRQNMDLNTIHRYPAEIKSLIRTQNKLVRKVKQFKKEQL